MQLQGQLKRHRRLMYWKNTVWVRFGQLLANLGPYMLNTMCSQRRPFWIRGISGRTLMISSPISVSQQATHTGHFGETVTLRR